MKGGAGTAKQKDAVGLFKILQEADPDIAQLLTSIGGNYALASVEEANPDARMDCFFRALGQCEVLKHGLLARLENFLDPKAEGAE